MIELKSNKNEIINFKLGDKDLSVEFRGFTVEDYLSISSQQEKDLIKISINILDTLFIRFSDDIKLNGKKVEKFSDILKSSNLELVSVANEALVWVNGVLKQEKK